MPKPVTVTLNAAARALFGDAERVRIRYQGGDVFILPTHRRGVATLPAGEFLVEVRRGPRSMRFELPVPPRRPSQPQRLEGRKYRWLACVAAATLAPGDPGFEVKA